MIPKIIGDYLRGKKTPNLLQRFSFGIRPISDSHVILFHAVSVGEVKALASFFFEIKKKFPQSKYVVTTTTVTGFEEAKRSLPGAHFYYFNPMDFSFVVNRFIKKIQPNLFFLSEGDVWPNLVLSLKKNGTQCFLLSAKLSERSFSRWRLFPSFAKSLFSSFSLICVQNLEYLSRFASLCSTDTNLKITGNLKLNLPTQNVIALKGFEDRTVVTLSCTHEGEEKMLLEKLFEKPWTFFIAPRHPERFTKVAHLLTTMGLEFSLFSQLHRTSNSSRIILVDQMGVLGSCYALSKAAVIGGSFVDHVGGHNILEPQKYGCVSVFGPHMFSQKEFVSIASIEKIGFQTNQQNVLAILEEIISSKEPFRERCLSFCEQQQGVLERTCDEIFIKL